MSERLNPAERIVHVLHTCGCTLLRVGVSNPAHCPTHNRLTEAVGSRWAHTAVYYAAAGDAGQSDEHLSTLDEGPRPSTHKSCVCGALRPFGHYYCGGERCSKDG